MEPDGGMNFADWTGAAQSLVAVAAIIVGAVWAFFRFVKGRTLKYKAELSVEGRLLGAGETRGIRVSVRLQNMGLTKIPLDKAFVRVLRVRPSGWTSRDWTRWDTVRIFEDHEWVEPQEPIGDEVLIPLREKTPALAYRLDVVVFPTKRRLAGPQTQWSARQVIGGVLQGLSLGDSSGAPPGNLTGREAIRVEPEEERRTIGEQREATEEEIRQLEREAETRQRHPTEEEVTQFEQEAEEAPQEAQEDEQSGDE